MGQGWFESDEDYRARMAEEANERIIEDSKGEAPSQGWFESNESYRARIAEEAAESIIEDSTGSPPSQGWFESTEDYRARVAQEASERIVEDSTGSAPSQGWFESADDYDVRVRREANEQLIESLTGTAPSQGWFEGEHDYRSRIAHEARETKAAGRPFSAETEDDEYYTPASSAAWDSLAPSITRSSTSGSIDGRPASDVKSERDITVGDILRVIVALVLLAGLVEFLQEHGESILKVAVVVVVVLGALLFVSMVVAVFL
jgi:hypothetical protein